MPELISTYIILLMLVGIVGFLLWQLSKTRLEIRQANNQLMTLQKKSLKKHDRHSTLYSVDHIKKLPDKILWFKFQCMLSNICIQNFAASHSRLNSQSNSRLVHIAFLDEATVLLKATNNQLMNLLDKYTIENIEEKMN